MSSLLDKTDINGLSSIEECQEFFDDNSEFDSILRFLFENTLYITREEILLDLEENINRWKIEREDRSLYVTLNDGKIGSEYYFYYTLKHLLPRHQLIIGDIPNDIQDGSEILYLDDWSLTGINMRHSYSRIFYDDFDENLGFSTRRLPNKSLHFTAILSIMTDRSIHMFDLPKYINETCKITQEYYYSTKFKCYYSHKVIPFVDLLSEHVGHKVNEVLDINYKFFERFCDTRSIDKEIKLVPKTHPNYKKIVNRSIPTFDAYPIHLDYKIANVYGSFYNIYKHCRFLAPSKEFMEDTIKFFQDVL